MRYADHARINVFFPCSQISFFIAHDSGTKNTTKRYHCSIVTLTYDNRIRPPFLRKWK